MGQAMNAGHELALEVVFNMPQHIGALLLDVGIGHSQFEIHRFGCNVKLVVQVVNHGAIGIQNHSLQGTHP